MTKSNNFKLSNLTNGTSNGIIPAKSDIPFDIDESAHVAPVKPPKHRGRLIVIEPLYIVFVLAVLGTALVKQQYTFYRFNNSTSAGERIQNNTIDCCRNSTQLGCKASEDQLEVQRRNSEFNVLNTVATGVPRIFAVMIWPTLSDSLGRRFSLIISLIGDSLDIGIMCLVAATEMDIHFILVGSAIAGISGGFANLLAICFAYIADTTEPGRYRTLRITLLEGSMGVSAMIGSLSVGTILRAFEHGHLKYVFTLLGTFSLLVACIIYAYFFVPESVEHTISVRNLGELTRVCRKAVLSPFLLFRDPLMERKSELVMLLLVMGTLVPGSYCLMEVKMLFQTKAPLCFGALEIGIFDALTPIAFLVGTAISFPLFFKVLHLNTYTALAICMMSNVMMQFLNAFSVNAPMMFTVPLVGAIGFVSFPLARSAMSALANKDQQGAVFALIALIQSVAALAMTAGFGAIYAATVGFINGGLVFLIAGTFVLGGMGMAIYLSSRRRTMLSNTKVDPGLLRSASTVPIAEMEG